MASRNLPLLFFGLLTSLLVLIPILSAAPLSKEKVLGDYEKAIALTEELNAYQEDTSRVLPKLGVASQALLRGDLEQADRVLGEALNELEGLRLRRPARHRETFQIVWLEIYLDVIQKYLILALAAYLLMRFRRARQKVQAPQWTRTEKVLWALPFIIFAIFFSLFDLSRYGESAWAFLDLQVVFVAIAGLLGGLGTGFLTGLGVGIFRWALKPDAFVYFGVALGSGILSGLVSRLRTQKLVSRRTSLAGGFLVGIFHAAAIYLPMGGFLPPASLAFSMGLVAALEGLAVFLFFSVVRSILGDEERREMEKELLKTRLLFLQAQINPHFLYNALNTISAICGREKALQAQSLVLRLSEFLRRTLRRVDDQITLKEEMSYIDSYLEIEKVRFGERLKVEKEFKIEEALWLMKIPFLILQPLVENAIKHGIGKKESGGTVKITARESSGFLTVEVEDDGVGMGKVQVERLLKGEVPPEEAGVGIGNIHQRLVRLFGPEYGLVFESRPHQGTRVTVRIPLPEASKR